jgi:hypothetical protein
MRPRSFVSRLWPLTLLLAGCGGADLPAPKETGRHALRIEARSARVVVIPQARSDVVASVRQAAGAEPLQVRREGAALVVSDGSAPRGGRCPAKPAGEGPVVTVHAPMDVDIWSNGAIRGEVGPAAALRLASGGCGVWRAASARGPAELFQAGGGSIRLGQANGPITVNVTGRGVVEIAGGVSRRGFLRVDGPGRIAHNGRVGTLRAELKGSGDIDVALVTGQVQRKLQGTGEVNWGRPKGRSYCAGTNCQRRRDFRGER